MTISAEVNCVETANRTRRVLFVGARAPAPS